MTTYTYQCLDCENVFEIKATIKEKEEGAGKKFACPKCHSKKTKQKFSVGNFFRNIFKGDGKKGDSCCPPQKGGESCCSDEKDKGGCCG